MEATQTLDFDYAPDSAEEPGTGADVSMDSEIGRLVVNVPDQSPHLYPLFPGVNVIGRQSTTHSRDQDRLNRWKEEWHDQPSVHGVFLDSTGVSATHAAIFIEEGGCVCFVKDLGSRNKTYFLKNAKAVALKKDDRYSLTSGEYIKLGALECRVEYEPPKAAEVASQQDIAAGGTSPAARAGQEQDAQPSSQDTNNQAQVDDPEATPDLDSDEEADQGMAPPAQPPPHQLVDATQLAGPGTELQAPGQGTLQAGDREAAQPDRSGSRTTSDLDSVWQPQLSAEDNGAHTSQPDITSPHQAQNLIAPTQIDAFSLPGPGTPPGAAAGGASPPDMPDEPMVKAARMSPTPSDLDEKSAEPGAELAAQRQADADPASNHAAGAASPDHEASPGLEGGPAVAADSDHESGDKPSSIPPVSAARGQRKSKSPPANTPTPEPEPEPEPEPKPEPEPEPEPEPGFTNELPSTGQRTASIKAPSGKAGTETQAAAHGLQELASGEPISKPVSKRRGSAKAALGAKAQAVKAQPSKKRLRPSAASDSKAKESTPVATAPADRKGKGKRKSSAPPEDEPALLGSTRKQLRRTSKPVKVLFSACVNAQTRSSLAKAITQLGGSVVNDGPEFTHFITLQAASGHNDRGFKKSLHALMALAAGRPIVVDSWVTASAGAGAWVDPVKHLLQDDAAEQALGFSLAASHHRACHSLLLTDVDVLLSPGLIAAEDRGAEGLKQLVALAGGQVVGTPPNKGGL
ncbi:hypothetical protein WJX73_003768 [Symbiochloris irregularis]|uniref:Mediator of DNA damage checkpoint protein 1 n=1 Tax=Symbiochloris irregularis TaxID=706552 RepID=A0AAW1PHL3_9CHLO